MTFLDVWVGYAIFGVTAFSVVFAWAVRARQFSNLDRGRYIPLDAGEPVAPDDRQCRGSRADRWGLALVVVIAAGLLTTALVLSIWSIGHGTHH